MKIRADVNLVGRLDPHDRHFSHAVFSARAFSDSLDFDERNLLEFAENAGFKEVHLELQVEIAPRSTKVDWDAMQHIAGNPKIPTLEEAMREALTPTEIDTFVRYLRPLVESTRPRDPSALAYLWAVK